MCIIQLVNLLKNKSNATKRLVRLKLVDENKVILLLQNGICRTVM